MSKPLKPVPGSHGRCPKCKNTTVKSEILPKEVAQGYGPELALCASCGAIWEPIDEGQIWDESDRYCSLSEPCDNCAFRPGSPEMEDKAKWRDLLAKLRAGSRFYCHKGVPIEPDAENGFAYPHKPDGTPNEKRLRLCRGYLNVAGKWWAKDFAEVD